jgi:hypothetical protein
MNLHLHFVDARYWFGCVHVISVVLSFISILTTSLIFNDLEDPGTTNEKIS